MMKTLDQYLKEDTEKELTFVILGGEGMSCLCMNHLLKRDRAVTLVLPWGIDEAPIEVRQIALRGGPKVYIVENTAIDRSAEAWFWVSRKVVDLSDGVVCFLTGRQDLSMYTYKYAKDNQKQAIGVPLGLSHKS